MPLRHIQEAERPTEPAVAVGRRIDDEAILDATRHLVLTQGMGRTTLTDVAREAGLSRMTVYRRYSGLPELLGRMMQREWDGLLGLDRVADALVGAPEASSPGGDVTGLRLLVRGVVEAATTLRESELLGSMIEREPQLLLPYLVERQGTMHRRAIALVAEGIRYGQADGSVAAGDPVRMATAVVLTVQSWVLSMDAAAAGQDRALLDEELRALLHAYLGPRVSA